MSQLQQLRDLGFRPAAHLEWTEDAIEFRFARWTTHADEKPVIYAYVDLVGSRILNIGQTSRSFRQRSSGYKSWINGRDKNRNAPINGAWLNCLLGECTSSKVEVWVTKSHVDDGKRQAEESRLIRSLNPILNTKA
jgi:hypothetical protein